MCVWGSSECLGGEVRGSCELWGFSPGQHGAYQVDGDVKELGG